MSFQNIDCTTVNFSLPIEPPASSVNNHIAIFSGTSGAVLKDSANATLASASSVCTMTAVAEDLVLVAQSGHAVKINSGNAVAIHGAAGTGGYTVPVTTGTTGQVLTIASSGVSGWATPALLSMDVETIKRIADLEASVAKLEAAISKMMV
jgi:hypothetical protein